jgi:diaminohydroxyphosphoribosylaminopyrimidine deaminase/5-amino-6-(5-phosphoribosylamino)uracil reductase
MTRALELAAQGQGYVEPNPMVGCVIARGETIVGEGWHQRFGGPHAEVEALAAAGSAAAGATMYVTLEPCCHHGKTPPCSEATIAARLERVVVAEQDPFPQVDGGGIRQLQDAGIQVEIGLLESDSRTLNAPYHKLVSNGRPWVIAKWAMTLDGKIATASGDSRWISNEQSRGLVHQLRGRVDAIAVGSRTAALDDPLLTARPPGPRTPIRIVLDTRASLAADSQLVRTAVESPVWVVVGGDAPEHHLTRLRDAGCEIVESRGTTYAERIEALLDEMGRRRLTNLLVEGGGALLGSLLDARQIDEVHVFVAPKLVGGQEAISPVGGAGLAQMSDALALDQPIIETLGGDVCVHGRVVKEP